MLGLPDEVPGDEVRIGRRVGDDEGIGRSCDHVDTDLAEEDALRLGDVLVAGTDNYVGLRRAEHSECHGGNALHAAEVEDPVGAAQVHREERRGGYADTGSGRRAGRDMGNARDPGGGDGHHRRCDVAVAAARHVAAGGADRNLLLAGPETRQDLDGAVRDRALLGLCEAPDIVVREADVVLQSLGNMLPGSLDGLRRDDDLVFPPVEFACKAAGDLVAAALQPVEHGLHSGANLLVSAFRGLDRLLQVSDRHDNLCKLLRRRTGRDYILPFHGTSLRSSARIIRSNR